MSRLKAKSKVLIVQSSHLDYRCLVNLEQYQIWQCCTVSEALEICQQEMLDCILLDYEFVDSLQELPSHIPVVLLTESEIENREYLVKKTITKELLISTIRNAIAQTKLKQELDLGIGISFLTQAIHSTFDLSTIYTTAKTAIAKLLNIDYVEICEHVPKSQTWIPSSQSSASLSFLDDHLINSQLLQGEIVSINSIVTPDFQINCIDSCQHQGSWLLVPLVVDLMVKGVLCLNGQRSTKHYWQDREIDLVNTIANQLGIAIQRSQAYSQVEIELADRRRIEVDLRQSQQLYATLAEVSPVGIFRTDPQGNCLYVNEKWCQISGITSEQALRLGWLNGIYESDRQLVYSEWFKAISDNSQFCLEYRLQNPEGIITWVYGQAVAELGVLGNIVGYVGTITDISDRKLGELRLQELNESLETKVNERTQEILARESQLRDFFDNSTDLIQSVSPEGQILFANAAWKKTLGYDDPSGLNIFQVIHPDSRAHCQSVMESMFQNLSCMGVEAKFLTKDGRTIIVEGNVNCRIENGKPVSSRGIFRDISDRKLIQEHLEQSEKKIRSIFKSMIDIVLTINLQDSNLESIEVAPVNDYIIDSHSSAVTSETIDAFFTPSNQWLEQVRQVILTGNSTQFDYALMVSGVQLWFAVNISRISESSAIWVARDISDRRQTEEQLLASTKELEQFFAMDLDLLCIADLDGHFLKLNQGWEGMLGYTLAELEGKKYLEFVHPDDIANTLEAIAKLETQEAVTRFVNRYRCKDGSYRYLEWHSRPLDNKIYASAHDITLQKEATDSLRISEQDLRTAQRVAHVGSWEFNLITQKVKWSEELFNIYGLDAKRPEPTYPELLQLLVPEDREKLAKQVEAAISTGVSYEAEHRIIVDGAIKWILGRGEVEKNAEGMVIKIFGTAMDTTALKEAAIALAQAKEEAEAGTRAKSEFLASMSHEIRTPMNGVLGMAELLAGTDLSIDQQEFVQTIRDSGDALLTIIVIARLG